MKRGGVGANRVRIIGGEHKGRRLNFPDAPGLRPTADRVRETLFNWLQPMLAGARCMDLFAGSGALGIEALSRGAAAVTFVDSSRSALRHLKRNLILIHRKSKHQTHRPVIGDGLRSDFLKGLKVLFQPTFH